MKKLPLAKITMTSPYGMRLHPIAKTMQLHSGVDLRAALNTPVYSVDNGSVILSKYVDGAGECIAIRHNDYYSYYCHLSKRKVQVGQMIHSGQTIALSGSTGSSTAPHLHFGLCKKFNISNFSKSSWYDPAEELEWLSMDTKPVTLLVNNKDNTIRDNYLKNDKNYTSLAEVLKALGVPYTYNAKTKKIEVQGKWSK